MEDRQELLWLLRALDATGADQNAEMDCDEAQSAMEKFARVMLALDAGQEPSYDHGQAKRFVNHLRVCPDCAGEFALVYDIEETLAQDDLPALPPLPHPVVDAPTGEELSAQQVGGSLHTWAARIATWLEQLQLPRLALEATTLNGSVSGVRQPGTGASYKVPITIDQRDYHLDVQLSKEPQRLILKGKFNAIEHWWPDQPVRLYSIALPEFQTEVPLDILGRFSFQGIDPGNYVLVLVLSDQEIPLALIDMQSGK